MLQLWTFLTRLVSQAKLASWWHRRHSSVSLCYNSSRSKACWQFTSQHAAHLSCSRRRSVQQDGRCSRFVHQFMTGSPFWNQIADFDSVLWELAKARISHVPIEITYWHPSRDYSQAIDVGTVKYVSAEAIRILLWVLGFMTFGYGTKEFEVTSARLGCYRPEDHIDNPKDYADNLDARGMWPISFLQTSHAVFISKYHDFTPFQIMAVQ